MNFRKTWHRNYNAAPLLLWASLASAAPEPRVALAAPRNFGYTLGDIVEQVLAVTVPETYTLETGFLPKPGALDEALEVRGADWEVDKHDGEAVYRIRIAYQVFKGARAAETVAIPALPLHFQGSPPMAARIPEWEFTVNPLIPPEMADEQVAIKDELPPAPISTSPHLFRLLACLAGASAVLGWLAWRRFGRIHRNRPFARAYRELKSQLRGTVSPEAYRAAARLLHRALDETAGHALFAKEVGRFCENRPGFAELREELAGFFVLSQRLFFTSPETPVPPDYPAGRLADLCRRCASAERRQA